MSMRVLLFLLFLSPTAVNADTPVFPEGYESWRQGSYTCAQSTFLEYIHEESVDRGEPDWIYRYQVRGEDIAVVIWHGNDVLSVEVRKGGAWISFQNPERKFMEALVDDAKIENGSATAEQIAQCQAQINEERNRLQSQERRLDQLR